MEDFERALLGHLSLKSSALCTKGESRTKQFMTANYMVTHYKKLQNVKSCVDTKPPKAMLYSTKARDQKLRQLTKSNSSAIAAIKAMLSVKNPNLGYLSPTVESQKLDGRSAIKTKPPKIDPTDILDIHSHKFTSGKPFVPRTNKSNCPSRLSQLNIYNPPPRAKSECQSQRSNSSMASSRDDQYSEYSQTDQTKTPKNQNSLKKFNDSESIKFDKPTMRLKSRRLSETRTTTGEITLRSPPPSSSHPSNLDVPPLNISLDQDNILWLKDLSDRRSKKTDLGSTTNLEQQLSLNTREMDNFGTLNSTFGNKHNIGLETSTKTSDLKNLEEDCKYIEFLQEVTADILQKGSYTNKVLTKIFEYHIDKHRNQLKEYKMREMINELRKDLGAQHEDDDDEIDGDKKSFMESGDYMKSNELPKNRNTATKKHVNVNLMENLSNNNYAQKEIKSKKLNQSKGGKEAKLKKAKMKIEIVEKTSNEHSASALIKEEDNVDSIHKWLSKQSDNLEPESAKRNEQKKESASRKKSRDDDDDETIATISSINDDEGDQDTEDLLEYYNTTIVNDDDLANQRCDNGFNRTTLSDIPEMSYRSEMVKQRSTDEEGNKQTQNGESDGIEKSIGFSGLEGEISSRISSSRSRRRAAMNTRLNEMNSARSSTIDTNRDVTTVKEEHSNASSEEQKNSTSENLKTRLFDDAGQLETSNEPTKSTGNSEKLETTDNDFVENAGHNNDEINSTTRMSTTRSKKNNDDEQKTDDDYSGDDKYDDDIEEECSISIDDVTELSDDDHLEKTNRSNQKSDV